MNPSASPLPFPTLDLLGMPLACVDAGRLLDHVFDRLAVGQGGWIVTANLDFLRRHAHDPSARALYEQADLRVADGMPLIWAARLQGGRLPERIAGSSLVLPIAERAASAGRSLYLLGGEPDANTGAAEVMRARWPSLNICGASSPMVASPPSADDIQALVNELKQVRPDRVLVGMGSPKQEQIIAMLRAELPRSWMIGVGISFSFVAGKVSRAPVWMQNVGLEWCWRLAQEPRRLARRYLLDDIPFSVELFARAAWKRLRSSKSG
jgi:N-acetylglucosaminyldiphosphoundecaprenol N-acetyl-beta-D-mannosaminyltransferase